MGKIVNKDVFVSINGTAISDHVASVDLAGEFEEVDVTSMGVNTDGAKYREFLQGLGDATVTLEVFQDYATGSIDSIFWPLSQTGGTFALVVRPTSAAASSTNPVYTMTGRVFQFNPLAGAVGEASRTPVVIRNGGTAGITRGTA